MRKIGFGLIVLLSILMRAAVAMSLDAVPTVVLRQFPLPQPAGQSFFNGRAIAFDGKTLWANFAPTYNPETKIYQVDTNGNLLRVLNIGVGVGSLAFNPATGKLYGGNYEFGHQGNVYQIDPASGQTSRLFTFFFPSGDNCFGQEPGFIDGLEYRPDSNSLQLSDDGGKTVYNVTLGGAVISSFSMSTTGGQCNSGIAFDGAGLWLVDVFNQRIIHTDLQGNPNKVLSTPGSFPEDLAYDTRTFAPACALWANEHTFKVPTIRAYQVPCGAPSFIQNAKQEMGQIADNTNLIGEFTGAASIACIDVPDLAELCAWVALVDAAQLIAAEIETRLANDPIDNNFTQVATPTIPSVPRLAVQPGITKTVADAFNGLLANGEQTIGIGDALYISLNRAAGASIAGDTFWLNKQLQVVAAFEGQFGALLADEGTLLTGLQSALVSGGFPTLAITSSDVLNFELQVASTGLPMQLITGLQAFGANAATIEKVTNALIVQNINAAAGTLPARLADSTFLASLRIAATAFGTPFAPFTAELEVQPTLGAFELGPKTIFTLGIGSNGINPLTEVVSLQVGSLSIIIPPGSFRRNKEGVFVYQGAINGVSTELRITSLKAGTYELQAEGSGGNLNATMNPVSVVFTIGDDFGATTSSANFD